MNRQFSANLSFSEREFRAPVRTNLNDTKAGAILPATTGYCQVPILIENENQLIANFGYPTEYNYKFWYECSGYLKNGSMLYVVRPIKDNAKNYGVVVKNNGANGAISSENMYNEEVALNTINNTEVSDDYLWFYNKHVNKNNDIAIVVISNMESYNKPLFNDTELVSGLSYYFKKPTEYINVVSGEFDIERVLDHTPRFSSDNYGHIYKGDDFIVGTEASFGSGQTNEADATNLNKIGVFSDVGERLTCTLSAGTPVVGDIYRIGDSVILEALSADGKFKELKSDANFVYSVGDEPAITLSLVDGTGDVSLTAHTFVVQSNVVICQKTEVGGYEWVNLGIWLDSSVLTTDNKYYVFQKQTHQVSTYEYYDLKLSEGDIPELADAQEDVWHLIVDGNDYNVDVDGKFYNYDDSDGSLSLYGGGDDYHKLPLGYNMVYTRNEEGIRMLSKIVPKYLVDSLYLNDGSIATGKDVLSPTPNFSKNEVGVLVFKREYNSRKFDLVESFAGSYASNAKTSAGTSNYIETIINKNSSMIYCKANETADLAVVGGNNTADYSIVDCMIIDDSSEEYDRVRNMRKSENADDKLGAMDLRNSAEEFSIRGNTIVNLLIGYDNGLNSGYLDDMPEIANESGMSLALVGYSDGDLAGMKKSNIRQGIIDSLGNKRSDTTSGALTIFNDYTFVISTSKLFYDRYNDKDRWMSMAGDVAGYMASNDAIRGSWFPVAGIERGVVSNYKRLLWSPSAVDQNELSRNAINSIVDDKELGYAYIFEYLTNTTENKITAEANVRRLIITLKDYLRTTLKGTFFSFNDVVERNAILYKISDTFENIKNRRGLYDYRLICDETNNTPDVINQKQFVVDVLIQPPRMVKFIKVNFLVFDSGFNLQEFEL